ncbi:MAG: nicotinate-nucleotide adenylyltransferase [Prochlorococcaceae cyanobacterium]
MSGPACVALLGTSADPPTRGHQALLEGLLELYPQVATWASDNPMKEHGAPLERRAALLASVVAAIADPRLELVQELSSPWAITTLKRAARRWPATELVFVVGSDLAGQIPRWKQAAQVLQRCRLAVVPRTGWPLGEPQLEALRSLGGVVEELPLRIPPTTSSQARRHPAPDQVAAAAWPLLLQHNLYGLSGQS